MVAIWSLGTMALTGDDVQLAGVVCVVMRGIWSEQRTMYPFEWGMQGTISQPKSIICDGFDVGWCSMVRLVW